jgi:hypothetical protein
MGGIILPYSYTCTQIDKVLKINTSNFSSEKSQKSGVSVAISAIKKTHNVNISDIVTDPTYTVVLIDKSGSMG